MARCSRQRPTHQLMGAVPCQSINWSPCAFLPTDRFDGKFLLDNTTTPLFATRLRARQLPAVEVEPFDDAFQTLFFHPS